MSNFIAHYGARLPAALRSTLYGIAGEASITLLIAAVRCAAVFTAAASVAEFTPPAAKCRTAPQITSQSNAHVPPTGAVND